MTKDRRDQSGSIATDRSVALRWGDPYGLFRDDNSDGEPDAGSYIPPGSLTGQRRKQRLTRAMTEGTAASSDQRNWGSYGAGNEPGLHNKPGV